MKKKSSEVISHNLETFLQSELNKSTLLVENSFPKNIIRRRTGNYNIVSMT